MLFSPFSKRGLAKKTPEQNQPTTTHNNSNNTHGDSHSDIHNNSGDAGHPHNKTDHRDQSSPKESSLRDSSLGDSSLKNSNIRGSILTEKDRSHNFISSVRGLAGQKLYKSYGQKPVLRGVSFHLRPGEVMALLGPNGAGKTTCFYSIIGLVQLDNGTIALDGTKISNLPMFHRARLGIGYLPQETSIFHDLTVGQNLMVVLELFRLKRPQRIERSDTLLREFRIEHLRRVKAGSLSGGERRRLEIARCLASRPNYLLLDEPFAGIDPIAIKDVQHIIRNLSQQGIGILITDHNVRDTVSIANSVAIFLDGQILIQGGVDEVMRNQRVKEAYLGKEFEL